jgi:hypothetical protein
MIRYQRDPGYLRGDQMTTGGWGSARAKGQVTARGGCSPQVVVVAAAEEEGRVKRSF